MVDGRLFAEPPDPIARSAIDSAVRRRGLLRRDEASRELLDAPELEPVALRENLRDIRRVNRLAGGVSVILRALPDLVWRLPEDSVVTLLDLATGSGDIPLAVAAWMKRSGRCLAMTVSDISPQILCEAQRQLAHVPGITYALTDARGTPFADGAFDIVLCSLALHHFPSSDAVKVLREMERLSRVGFILNDIRRSLPGLYAANVVSRIATRNALTRHDMPLSVRRAYTPDELRALLAEAGIDDAIVASHPLFRMSAVRVKSVVAENHV
jgi:ubiquinone/menaquinone biosynthesis C-methylase UbiE